MVANSLGEKLLALREQTASQNADLRAPYNCQNRPSTKACVLQPLAGAQLVQLLTLLQTIGNTSSVCTLWIGMVCFTSCFLFDEQNVGGWKTCVECKGDLAECSISVAASSSWGAEVLTG